MQCEQCPRGRDDCTPLANLMADDQGSFICVGYNQPEHREVTGDRFTHCWKNDVTDERGHWDRRDLIDTISVMSQALSIDENIRTNNGWSDDQMNEQNFQP
jgi:hypothetical protein